MKKPNRINWSATFVTYKDRRELLSRGIQYMGGVLFQAFIRYTHNNRYTKQPIPHGYQMVWAPYDPDGTTRVWDFVRDDLIVWVDGAPLELALYRMDKDADILLQVAEKAIRMWGRDLVEKIEESEWKDKLGKELETVDRAIQTRTLYPRMAYDGSIYLGGDDYDDEWNQRWGQFPLVTTPSTPRPVVVEQELKQVVEPEIKVGELTVKLRGDGQLWTESQSMGARVITPVAKDLLLRELTGRDKGIELTPEIIKIPDSEWMPPQEYVYAWGQYLLALNTQGEAGGVIGRHKKDPKKWIMVIPQQRVSSWEVEIDDYAPAFITLGQHGYRKVGTYHTHPGSMTACSEGDTTKMWHEFGGLHFIMARTGGVGVYMSLNGQTWELREHGYKNPPEVVILPDDSVIGQEGKAPSELMIHKTSYTTTYTTTYVPPVKTQSELWPPITCPNTKQETAAVATTTKVYKPVSSKDYVLKECIDELRDIATDGGHPDRKLAKKMWKALNAVVCALNTAINLCDKVQECSTQLDLDDVLDLTEDILTDITMLYVETGVKHATTESIPHTTAHPDTQRSAADDGDTDRTGTGPESADNGAHDGDKHSTDDGQTGRPDSGSTSGDAGGNSATLPERPEPEF